MPPQEELDTYLALVAKAGDDMRSGRSPRVKSTLKKAARALAAARRHASAEEAQGLLARLELRAGNARRALNAGRSALRAGRGNGAGEPFETLRLLAWLYAAAGEPERAVLTAQRAVKAAAGDPLLLTQAWVTVSWVQTETGRFAEAVVSAEEAVDAASGGAEAQLPAALARLGNALLRCGCCQAAEGLAKSATHSSEEPIAIQARLLRGNCKVMVGALDGAARYFRAAARGARAADDPRLEALSLAALGAALRARPTRTGEAPASAALARAGRLARRVRDAQLNTILERLEAEGLGHPPVPTPKAAAGWLVEQACASESPTLAEACTQEAYYLTRLDPTAPPYPYRPLPLDIPLL